MVLLIIINLEEQAEINGHILAAGEHCVRALLLLGTADLKAHQDIALYTGGYLNNFKQHLKAEINTC